MKKLLFSFLILCFSVFSISAPILAADTPIYDSTFNNNAGAFFANGTPITITEGTTADTVNIAWDSTSLEIPSTTRIFGGGRAGTVYDSSSVTLNSGTVSFIYGGGFSTDSNNIATVTNSNVVVNGGNVTQTLYGGGLLYTTVDTSNVTINGGTVNSVLAGGAASSVISGEAYSTGTEENPEASGTRVSNGNLTINDGTVTTSAWGGGQGYSYTGNTNVTVNSGDLSTAYLTAGGSNGYTGNANVKINGGDIDVYQTTNRGTVETANTTVTGGNVNTFYLGGEPDPTVTGTIENVSTAILGGTVRNLFPGTTGTLPLETSGENVTTVIVPGTVTNNNIPSGDTETITYNFTIIPDQINVFEGLQQQIPYTITTTPPGYENLFEDTPITWTSSNPSVATVDENGIVTGIAAGTATIIGTFLDQTDTVEITVTDSNLFYLIWILLLAFFLLLAIFSTRRRH